MRGLAMLAVAGVLVSAAAASRPVFFFRPLTVVPGDAITYRSPGVKIGHAGVAIRSADGRFTRLRNPAMRTSLRATVPNVPAGSYAVKLLRRGRIVATARQRLRILEARPGVRDCDSSVYGDFGPGWERRTVWAGPLGLVGATAGNPPKPAKGRPDYFEPVKFVLVLENSEVATIRVPASERAHVALLYATRGGLGEYGFTRVVDGLPAVRFEACAPSEVRYTQFTGGFVVDSPRCAELEVHVRGRAEPYPLQVPFGRAC
jgi:hypothetical protein